MSKEHKVETSVKIGDNTYLVPDDKPPLCEWVVEDLSGIPNKNPPKIDKDNLWDEGKM